MPDPHLYAWLQERYPATFPLERAAIKPLKVNIHLDNLAQHPKLDIDELRRALACWCGRPTYLRAVQRGGARIDLTGQAAGEVTPEQAAYATERLQWLAERAQRRRAAATKPVEKRTAATPAVDIPPATPALARIPSRPILTLKRRAGT